MIHVICTNPALDKLYTIAGFAAGEDYPGQRPRTCIGGKGVNVARVLSQLGERVHLYAFLGERGGEAIRREMRERCACTFLPVAGACRTTVNIIDPESGRETVITEAGPQANMQDAEALLDALRSSLVPGDVVCCSGSLIAGVPEDLYGRVSRLCAEAGARCTLDCNVQTLPASLADARYALGKPNERELCALLGVPRTREAGQIVRLARRKMPPFDMLLVSMGAQGGVLVSPEEAYAARVPPVPVVSTVGSGDASLAGALAALAHGLPMEQMLRLAMSCGTANAMSEKTGSIELRDLERVMEKTAVEPLEEAPV